MENYSHSVHSYIIFLQDGVCPDCRPEVRPTTGGHFRVVRIVICVVLQVGGQTDLQQFSDVTYFFKFANAAAIVPVGAGEFFCC